MHTFIEYAMMFLKRQPSVRALLPAIASRKRNPMRTFRDRVRHALTFEAVALAIFIPGSAALFGQPPADMGVIGIASATIATLWNFVFNMGFDRTLLRLRGTVHKTVAIRVAHTFLFEAGLVVMLIPMIAWYLGISLWDALLMDVAIVVFYLVYGFLFNLAYDRVFPVGSGAAARGV